MNRDLLSRDFVVETGRSLWYKEEARRESRPTRCGTKEARRKPRPTRAVLKINFRNELGSFVAGLWCRARERALRYKEARQEPRPNRPRQDEEARREPRPTHCGAKKLGRSLALPMRNEEARRKPRPTQEERRK